MKVLENNTLLVQASISTTHAAQADNKYNYPPSQPSSKPAVETSPYTPACLPLSLSHVTRENVTQPPTQQKAHKFSGNTKTGLPPVTHTAATTASSLSQPPVNAATINPPNHQPVHPPIFHTDNNHCMFVQGSHSCQADAVCLTLPHLTLYITQ